MELVKRGAFIAPIVLAVALAACGGGENNAPSATHSAASSTAAAATASGTPSGTQAPLTLSATVSPESAAIGETVTVTFTTAPNAVIGFQVVDAAGKTTVQVSLTAHSDGTAVYKLTAAAPAGKWLVSAAAGRSVFDLLRLQAAPTAGPNTADVNFEVR